MHNLLDRYTRGLLVYVESGSEQALVDIEDLGAEAIGQDVAVDELTGLHEGGMLALVEQQGGRLDPEAIRRMSACFAALMLSALLASRARIDLLEWQREQERRRTERTRQRLESLGQMVGGVAHELNNLLQPVCGLGELLLLDLDAARPERKSIEIIDACARNAASVVGKILDYVRQTASPRAPMPLGNAVEAAIAFLKPVLLLKPTLTVSIDDHTSMVMGAENELTQVLLNLLQNADQVEARSITVGVRRGEHRFPDGGGPIAAIALVVADDGRGMPPDVVARASEPFFTTKAAGEGSGLGLAIVSGIARDWRGQLSITSALGVGTTVALHLPVIGA